jgi:hypothetical protein
MTLSGARSKPTAGVLLLLHEQKGVSLIIALLALLVLTFIGISAISTAVFEISIAGNERVYNDAFYIADAGVDFFYGTSKAYIHAAQADGVIDSRNIPLALGGGYFVLHWRRIGEDPGPPKRAEFFVISEGASASASKAGRVKIEAVIETADKEPPLPEGMLKFWREVF